MTRQQIFAMYLANKNQKVKYQNYIGKVRGIDLLYNQKVSFMAKLQTVKCTAHLSENISDCQLILTPIREISEEHKKELCSLVPMEQEDLEILTGGTMHLATLDDMVKITDFLKLNGYTLDDSWFESKDGQLPIAVRGME